MEFIPEYLRGSSLEVLKGLRNISSNGKREKTMYMI
jgi:hypothetical protein